MLKTDAATFAGKTAEEWRAEAARCRKASADSFDRCDTDGALSQWASDTMAHRYDACAEVAENGGTMEVCAVFLLDGTLASVDYREGQYGWYFLLNDAAAEKLGTRFVSTSSARKAKTRATNNAKKGVTEGAVRVPAKLNNKTGEIYADRDAVNRGEYEISSVDCYQTVDH